MPGTLTRRSGREAGPEGAGGAVEDAEGRPDADVDHSGGVAEQGRQLGALGGVQGIAASRAMSPPTACLTCASKPYWKARGSYRVGAGMGALRFQRSPGW
jgi:hypothetical protein